MNYTELTQFVTGFSEYEEADFVAAIPQFIKNAEERICRTVFLPYFRKTATSNFTAGNKFLAAPVDFLTPYYLTVTSGTTVTALINKEPDWLLEAYATTTTQGLPLFYALHDDDSIVVGPTPDSAYACELSYNHQPESIVTASTTWLGDNAQQALLYGALCEAAIYMRQDQDVMEKYEARFQEGIDQLSVFGGVRSRKDDYRRRDMRKGTDT